MPSTTDPGDAGRRASCGGASFKLREEFENEEDIGKVVYLHNVFVAAGTCFMLQNSDAGIQEQVVDNRQLCFDGFGKTLNRFKVVHVKLHDLDRGVFVVLLYGWVRQ